jgi:Holliday junction resolvase
MRKEIQVGEFYERQAYSWKRAFGSRGPVDVIARKGSQRHAIQVKSTRARAASSSRLTAKEEARLLSWAKRMKMTPVLALVCGNYVWLLRVPDYLPLLEGELKPLKYDYPDET